MEPEIKPEILIDATAANAPTKPDSEDHSDASVRSDSEVTSPARTRWVLLGLAGLVAVFVGLSQWQRGEPAAPQTEDEDSAAAGHDRTDESENDSEDESGLTAVEPQQVVPGSGPLLGEETGLALVISQPATNELRLLDLDTGTEYELAGRGRVQGVLDDQLVIHRNGTVSLLPFDSPDQTGTELVSPEQLSGETVEVVGVANDAVWLTRLDNLTGPIGNDYAIEAYDSAGNLVDERTLDGSSLSLGPPVWGELSQEIGGGIYRREGNSHQRVSGGWIAAAGDELALVREYDEQRQCDLNWYRTVGWVGRYRISDWEGPLPLPSPDVSGVAGAWLTIQGNDRWLVEHSWSIEQMRIFDVSTGQLVREQPSSFDDASPFISSFSADGRWLMQDDVAGFRIIDLDTGAEYAYESELTGPSSTLTGIFVNRNDVGFIP